MLSSFQNPVYPHSFPDPFVLRYQGIYWAYSTGAQEDGKQFGLARSADLITWEFLGGAMQPLDEFTPCYWAPEVTIEEDGTFLLYYSAGNEETMVIRVAQSTRPEGPFMDCGVALTREPFAIDAHVFIDSDSVRYLFYATDFLEYAQVGTGTVCDRMVTPFQLAGKPRPVTRAKFDWQVYDPKRANKGNVKWHTIEGPTVLKHKGTYFEMFSGGNWQNISYGVSYATTSRIDAEEEWTQHADGSKILPILRTVPERVIGPGHNSVVMGPDNRQRFCVYHEWVGGERTMAIDRLDFVGDRLFILGPTRDNQPSPIRARSIDPAIIAISEGESHQLTLGGTSCLVVCSVRLEGGHLSLISDSSEEVRMEFDAADNAWQELRIEIDERILWWSIGSGARHIHNLSYPTGSFRLSAIGGTAELRSIELTRGWEDWFDGPSMDMSQRGWRSEQVLHCHEQRELEITSSTDVSISRTMSQFDDFEIVVNLRLPDKVGSVGFQIGSTSILLSANNSTQGLYLRQKDSLTRLRSFTDLDVQHHHQIRLYKVGTEALLWFEAEPPLSISMLERPEILSLVGRGRIAFDLCRVTEIPQAS